MKKQIVITLFATVLLALSGMTEARDSNRGHRGYQSNHAGSGYSNKHARRHYRGNHYRNRHYGYNRHGRRHHGLNDGLKYAAGAIVLGSIIHSISRSQPRQVTYRSQPAVTGQDYWYRVDSEGQCVEVRLNQQGREVWTYVGSSNCN